MTNVAMGAGVVRLPVAPAVGLYLDHCYFSHYDVKWGNTAEHPSLTYLSPPSEAAKKRFKEEVVWPVVSSALVGGDSPFAAYAAAALADPPPYRFSLPKHYTSLAGGKRKPETDADKLLEPLAPTFRGAVSKQAREEREFRNNRGRGRGRGR